jgi:hypothetical protein
MNIREGLTGRDRAIVCHIKHDKLGVPREHCHVVWSRIDAEKGKAVQLAYDREKLMMVTKAFARDHGLELPKGYERGNKEERSKNRQLSLYEKRQQDVSGITKEERIRVVTEAWRRSDSARAFVSALEDLGYILATGNRPYVLVDIYGNMNALPKMIDDRQVRTNDIRAFLEKDFPTESLPGVDEARSLARRHQQAVDDFEKAEKKNERFDILKRQQEERRRKLEAERADMRERHRQAESQMQESQADARRGLKAAFLTEAKRVREERHRNRPTGLAAFLGRITGVQLVIRKVQKYRDRKRYQAFVAQKGALKAGQAQDRQLLQRHHEILALDMDRRLRALDQVEERERKSVETALKKDRRVQSRARGGHAHMPALTLELKPPGRRALVHKAKNRYRTMLPPEEDKTPSVPKAAKIELKEALNQAARKDEREEGSGESGAGGERAPKPIGATKAKRLRRKLLREFEEAASPPDDRHAVGGGGGDHDHHHQHDPGHDHDHDRGRSASTKPAQEAEPRVRRRRRRDRDQGRER